MALPAGMVRGLYVKAVCRGPGLQAMSDPIIWLSDSCGQLFAPSTSVPLGHNRGNTGEKMMRFALVRSGKR